MKNQRNTGFSISGAKRANERFHKKQQEQQAKEIKGIELINALLSAGSKQIPPTREGWQEEAKLLMKEVHTYMKYRKANPKEKLPSLFWNKDWAEVGLDIKVVKEVPKQSPIKRIDLSDKGEHTAKRAGSQSNQISTVPIARGISLSELARAAMTKRASKSKLQQPQDGGK